MPPKFENENVRLGYSVVSTHGNRSSPITTGNDTTTARLLRERARNRRTSESEEARARVMISRERAPEKSSHIGKQRSLQAATSEGQSLLKAVSRLRDSWTARLTHLSRRRACLGDTALRTAVQQRRALEALEEREARPHKLRVSQQQKKHQLPTNTDIHWDWETLDCVRARGCRLYTCVYIQQSHASIMYVVYSCPYAIAR